MLVARPTWWTLLVLTTVACGGHAPKPTPAPRKVKLAVMPAESDTHPTVAKAATQALTSAQVHGIDETEVSKVSLEVVQLSIECVEPTEACFEAVGHSLAADQLLFAQIASEKRHQLKVTVTLFDVGTRAARHQTEKVFASDRDAIAGIPALVAEATAP